ncbi:MAG: acyl-CoA thioesterase [Rhodospirillales bacterium]|nr:acyl-CoA thioesterase [Rhodospirillales bacterium]
MTDQSPSIPLEKFPVTVTEKLRFGDTDRLGHINNAVFATLCESGRVAFLYDPDRSLLVDGTQFVIAKLTINFLAEMNWPGDVVVGTGVTRTGNSSFDLTQGLFVDGKVVATCDSVLVLMDEQTRRATPLSETTRYSLAELSIDLG